MNVLIVDDNEKIRNFIKDILTSWGHNILEAENGEAGIESFIKNKPEVVLMDIRMEQMDGIQAAEIIRKNSADVKIIMVTDYNNKLLREKAKEAGANDYVLKENLLELKKIIEFTN